MQESQRQNMDGKRTITISFPGSLVCMHYDAIPIAHEPVDGVVLMHGGDAGILSCHLRLKLKQSGRLDLTRIQLDSDNL